MDLADELGKRFAAEFRKVMQKEIDEHGYLAQEEFANSDTPCTDRGKAMVRAASEVVENIAGLAIAEHRTATEGEDHSTEMVSLEAKLSDEDQEVAKRSWWRG
jgi:hypothetical protein